MSTSSSRGEKSAGEVTPPKSTSTSRARVTVAVAAWLSIALSLYLIFFVAREADAAMGGQLQRIFYFHVPAAWVAYLGFAVVFVGSIAYLRTGSARWDIVAHSAAETGFVFCTLVLVTGPIWARPVWGTWWQWDARLTSALVLWLTYAGYLFLRYLATDPSRAGKPAAVLGIIGFVNVPIVHFSVYWWRTLHPSGPTPANLEGGSGLGGAELAAFFTALVGFTLLFMWLLSVRGRMGLLGAEVERLELSASLGAQSPAKTMAT